MKAILKAIEAENNRPKFISQTCEYTNDNQRTIIKDNSPPDDSPRQIQKRPKTSKAIVNFARAKEKAKTNKVCLLLYFLLVL